MEFLLEVKNLNSFYNESHIIEDITFNLKANETVILLGRNGMGKTTLVRSIMNLTPPQNTGKVIFEEEDISQKNTNYIAKKGIGLVPQGRRLFPSLTVNEHLEMSYNSKINHKWSPEKIYDIFPELNRRKKNMGTDLSGGEQQMLAIGRALVTKPKLLIMDEPLEGLAPVVSQRVVEVARQLKKEGLSIFWIEQKVKKTKNFTDRVFIIEKGKLVYADNADDFDQNTDVKRKHLGL